MTHHEQIQEILDLNPAILIAVPPELRELVEVTIELANLPNPEITWGISSLVTGAEMDTTSEHHYCLSIHHWHARQIVFVVQGYGTPREALAEARARYAVKLAEWEASNGTPGR